MRTPSGPVPVAPGDVFVALRLAAHPAEQSVRTLAGALGIPKSSVALALGRLREHRLLVDQGDGGLAVNRLLLRDLLENAIRWLAPASPAADARWVLGLPTAHAAPVLASKILANPDPVVIPLEEGTFHGRAVVPLHPAAGRAAARDPALHELLAIVDALRIGSARDRDVARLELRARL